MDDIQKIQEEEMTTEEVLDRYTEEPRTSVEMLPEWEEYPEEAPGENTRVEDDTLIWERDGFEIRLESFETTHWKADISVPHEYGKHYARPIDAKCGLGTEHTYVEDVETEDYALSSVTLLTAANFMPVHEVQKFVDAIIDDAQASEQFIEEMEAKLDAAADSGE